MKPKIGLLLGLITLSYIASSVLSAADRDATVNLSTKSFKKSLKTRADLFGLDSNNALKAKKSYIDANGDTTTRFVQMYKGIPVLGDDIIVTRDKRKNVKSTHGFAIRNIKNDIDSVSATIDSNKAISIAKSINYKKNASYENETSKLSIWQDKASKARLVYVVSYVVHSDKPSRPYFIIDANSGAVLDSYENIQHAEASGPGGNEKYGHYEYGVDFPHIDVRQTNDTCELYSQNVKTIDLNHQTSGNTIHSFSCPENLHKEINGAYSPLNDAHYFGNVVFNMYSDWLNTAPLSFQLTMKVHYSSEYENAFWDGSSMSFGDGANYFHPLVSLDVSAHEVSHGFTEQNSGLVYREQSGGLNESFSDIAGEAAEFYSRGSNDWLVGADIIKNGTALRYMEDPTLDGRSIDNQADYTSNMDVHYSSGVYNKAFFLLATTEGWDTKKAFEVYARANMLYWTANTDWNTAGGGVLDAACDLGYNVEDAQQSLIAVGISSVLSPNSTCEVTTPPEPEPEPEPQPRKPRRRLR